VRAAMPAETRRPVVAAMQTTTPARAVSADDDARAAKEDEAGTVRRSAAAKTRAVAIATAPDASVVASAHFIALRASFAIRPRSYDAGIPHATVTHARRTLLRLFAHASAIAAVHAGRLLLRLRTHAARVRAYPATTSTHVATATARICRRGRGRFFTLVAGISLRLHCRG
jgi:predicted house-cleaning NTP pyrophosphatase (Maf/HAM1 superfamily)